MKLEEQVCSLELAKKLKSLGVKQESVFYWGAFAGHYPDGQDFRTIVYYEGDRNIPEFSVEEICSAFTCSELGEMLPYGHGVNAECDDPGCEHEDDGRLKITKDSYTWFVQYVGFKHLLTADKNLANGMARMLIYLLEQGIVKP